MNTKETESNNEKLLTAQAVGATLSLSKRAVFRMRSAGLICEPVKVGAGAIRWFGLPGGRPREPMDLHCLPEHRCESLVAQ